MNPKPNRPAFDVLAPKKQAFAELQRELAERIHISGTEADPELVERTMNAAIDLIEGLEVAAGTPKHIHGERYDTYNQQQLAPGRDLVQQQYVAPRQVIHHTTEVNVPPNDRMYKINEDLIIGMNGHFVFRPISRKLHTAVGEIDLSVTEAIRLLDFLKYDYQL
ncbi:hypothetical protein [Fibrella aquatilis]|uniref:Uncharacterized protein n=1 Tax=Fibrella aquatilis TaxID=2817059 RepID=A0A939K1V0_9BACT|nr:hypothetical protein [Fibrella aquatilis]MBO0933893.1 hypothetical protein [Fibrella aquatilis]